jgi:hypothetical protein
MCEKSKLLKHFFVVLNHPYPLQKALAMGVVKHTPDTRLLFEKQRNQLYLTKTDIQSLGLNPPKESNVYLVPIQIPRDWFLH